MAKLSVRCGKKEVFLAAIGWGRVRSALLWFLLKMAENEGFVDQVLQQLINYQSIAFNRPAV